MTARSAKILGALRHLACLGLPGKSVVPEVMGLLNDLAGFDLWGVRFVDAQCRLVDGLASPDIPAPVLQDFAENFHDREANGAEGVTASSVMRSGLRVVATNRFVDQRKLHGTAFWERIMRPTGMGLPIQVPLVQGNRPFSVIVMSRPIGTPDFSAATIRLLEQAQPWLCHALVRDATDRTVPDEPAHTAGDTGLLVIDPSGRIESASPGAITLLLNASGSATCAGSLQRVLDGNASALLSRLAQAVGANLNGRPAPLPAGTIRNEYGIFRLRAYALEAHAAELARKVALHIERSAPTSLRLFASPRFLALTNREREVAMCLMRGRSYPETATDLGIKPSSAIYYVRSLFRRLDIDTREQLPAALLTTGGRN